MLLLVERDQNSSLDKRKASFKELMGFFVQTLKQQMKSLQCTLAHQAVSIQVALPSINEVVGAETADIPNRESYFPELWITSNMYSAIFLPPEADGSTRAT